MKHIRWESYARDSLPEALLGNSSIGHPRRLSFEPSDIARGEVLAGFAEMNVGSTYERPCIFVVDQASASETFSWLRAYAPETAPLSQFGRVVSLEEWHRFNAQDDHRRGHFRDHKWASLIVGEALAQSEADIGVASLPISRASACFSTAIARTLAVHGTDESTRICADRLSMIEGDRRFARRFVRVDELVPIWALLGARFAEPLPPHDAVQIVVDGAKKYMSDVVRRGRPSVPITDLRDFPEIASDSIEERVLAFQRISSGLIHATDRVPRDGLPAVLMAGAAFLVGRGTSHEFLLRRVRKVFPVAEAWFGLIAALTGPAAWDPDWTRAAKSVERHLRAGFYWTDSTGFDLSWTEFAWLAGAFEGPEVFSTIPKLVARAVSIEIVPGSSCQFKLAAGRSMELEGRTGTASNEREKQLSTALAQFISLATKTRQLLEGQSAPVQQSLGLLDRLTQESRGARSKKNRPPDR